MLPIKRQLDLIQIVMKPKMLRQT